MFNAVSYKILFERESVFEKVWSLDFSSFHGLAVVVGLEEGAVLDPFYIPLITLFSLPGSVISHTQPSSCRASLWPLVIYLEKQQIE